jgi:hypothetical protein
MPGFWLSEGGMRPAFMTIIFLFFLLSLLLAVGLTDVIWILG